MLIFLTCRDFQGIDESRLAPIIKALGPIANVSVESQVVLISILVDDNISVFLSFKCHPFRILFISALPIFTGRFYTIHQSPRFRIGMRL